jgi:hypothetical protein
MTGVGSPLRALRFPVALFVATGDDMTPLGRTRNISTSGMFLETTTRPAVGTVQAVSIVWGDDTLEFATRVVRHAADGVGLAFLDPDPAICGTLGAIIKNEE